MPGEKGRVCLAYSGGLIPRAYVGNLSLCRPDVVLVVSAAVHRNIRSVPLLQLS